MRLKRQMVSRLSRFARRMPGIDELTRDQPMHTHKIRIDDQVLHLAMPHNFDPDMPLSPMPEHVQISQSDFKGDKVRSLHVWRGWWSFYTPGFLSREIGSLMLSIDVYEIPLGFDRDIFVRENFIEAIQINLINRYAAHNRHALDVHQEDLEVFLPLSPMDYKEEVHRNQPWNYYSVASPKGADNFTAIGVPLGSRHYLELSFHPHAPMGKSGWYVDTVGSYIEWIGDTCYLERSMGVREISREVKVGNRFGIDFSRVEETGDWTQVELINPEDTMAMREIDVEGLKAAGVEYDLDLWPELWMQVNAEAYARRMHPLEFQWEARRRQACYPLRHEGGD